MQLTREQRELYNSNGFLVVPDLIPEAMLRQVRHRISEIVETVSRDRGARVPGKVDTEPNAAVATKPALRKLSELAYSDEFFRSVANYHAIVDIGVELTQSDGRLKLYSDQAFLKPAFEGSEKPLHQDNSYFRITPHHAGVTCWIAVDDSTVENGCMRYIAGSHKLGLLPHKAISAAHLTPEVNFKLGEEVAVPIPAGAEIFHHLLTLHSSGANTSPKSRRAWALHLANPAGESPVRPWTDMLDLR